MTGWSVCPCCRAVVWRDVMSRTFGHAPGCPNAKYMVTPPSTAGSRSPGTAGTAQRGVFAKRPGKAVTTAYSSDARGDCRPNYEKGTGNFTISQASRFPPDKKPDGADGDYNPGYMGSIEQSSVPTRKPASSAFKDKRSIDGPKCDSEDKSSWKSPDTVGPATYLKHSSWLDGNEIKKRYSGGTGLRSKQARDIYGPGGMANLGMVSSPKRTNCYVAHDPENEWTKKTPATKLAWSQKGRSFGGASRFGGPTSLFSNNGTPGPGEYYGSLSRPYSSLNTKIMFRDPDAITNHRTPGDRPFTGPA